MEKKFVFIQEIFQKESSNPITRLIVKKIEWPQNWRSMSADDVSNLRPHHHNSLWNHGAKEVKTLAPYANSVWFELFYKND